MKISTVRRFFNKISMKYILGILSIPPLMGLFAGWSVKYSLPKILNEQYSIDLSLKSFFYSKSYWTLTVKKIDQEGSQIEYPLLFEHGPWISQRGLAVANALSLNQLPTAKQPEERNDLASLSIDFLGTVHYNWNQNESNLYPHHVEGSFNLIHTKNKGSIQGSFFFKEARIHNANINFECEKTLIGVPEIAVSADIERIEGLSQDQPWSAEGVDFDIIPAFQSWRGSIIVTAHADQWMEKRKTLSDLSLDLSILNAKTKLMHNALSLAYASLPFQAQRPELYITQYQSPDPLLETIDLIDPEWATLTLSDRDNEWQVRVAQDGELVQIDARGYGTQLHQIWQLFLPHNLLSNLTANQVKSQSWADQLQYIELSSQNFEEVTWSPAIAKA